MIEACADIASTVGVPWLLVNNAAIQDRELLVEAHASEWDRIFAVNARGAFLMTREIVDCHTAGAGHSGTADGDAGRRLGLVDDVVAGDGAVIAIVGATVASVKTTGALEPTLPAASVSWATMLWLPLPGSVTVVDQAPPTTVAVPICVVTPLTVSNNVTVDPATASVAATVPEIVCVD